MAVKYWLGTNEKVYFYTSELNTAVAYPTSTLAGAASGGIKIRLVTTGNSTSTYIIPLFAVAAS